jgi:hypothetical protein
MSLEMTRMIDPKQHYESIRKLALVHESLIDAAIAYAAENNYDEETMGQIIKANPELVDDIRVEAEKLRLLPKISRLPDL